MTNVAVIQTEVRTEKGLIHRTMLFSSIEKALEHFKYTSEDLRSYDEGKEFQLKNLESLYFGYGKNKNNEDITISIYEEKVY